MKIVAPNISLTVLSIKILKMHITLSCETYFYSIQCKYIPIAYSVFIHIYSLIRLRCFFFKCRTVIAFTWNGLKSNFFFSRLQGIIKGMVEFFASKFSH